MRLKQCDGCKMTQLNSLVRQAVFSETGNHLAIATPENVRIFSQRNSSQNSAQNSSHID